MEAVLSFVHHLCCCELYISFHAKDGLAHYSYWYNGDVAVPYL